MVEKLNSWWLNYIYSTSKPLFEWKYYHIVYISKGVKLIMQKTIFPKARSGQKWSVLPKFSAGMGLTYFLGPFLKVLQSTCDGTYIDDV